VERSIPVVSLDKAFERSAALGYYAAMASAAAVAALLATVAGFAADHRAQLPDLLARVAVFLGVVNLAGAALVFAPIRRLLGGDSATRDAAARRISALSAASGLWIGALAAAAMLGHSAAVHSSWGALLQSSPRVLAGTLLHVAGFGVYLGLYAYFVTLDYSMRLRERLWRSGERFPARGGKLVYRLVAALIAVAAAPLLIVLSDQWTQAAAQMPMGAAMRHGAFMRQTLQMDLLAALVLVGVVIWLVVRGLARPVDVLLGAMHCVECDDLRIRAPVVSDDELGLLTERFNRMLAGLEERDRIRRTFARFVPESVAAGLLANEGAIVSQEREATVLFADIENFTAIASRLAPREVVQMLNDYFAEIARVIHAHRGVITQFQGDAVLASFNLPVADPEHARHAVEAALEAQARLREATFVPGIRLHARIGIASGPVVGGTVGGDERLGYTVHGDTVNLAARLEALNKELGSRILLSPRTAQLVDGGMTLRDRGTVPVRGFTQPLRVFEPVAAAAALVP
jgi:class 3 adenylate cyclase